MVVTFVTFITDNLKNCLMKKINSNKTFYHSITPTLEYYGTKRRVEFNGSCLKQDKITFNHGKVVNIYIVYEINKNINISGYPTLGNCWFGAVRLTKNADIDKYKYSGYGVGFIEKYLIQLVMKLEEMW